MRERKMEGGKKWRRFKRFISRRWRHVWLTGGVERKEEVTEGAERINVRPFVK